MLPIAFSSPVILNGLKVLLSQEWCTISDFFANKMKKCTATFDKKQLDFENKNVFDKRLLLRLIFSLLQVDRILTFHSIKNN